MSCPICGWHPGFRTPPTESQYRCPRVHTYKPDPEYAAAMDERGAHEQELDEHERGAP